MLTVDFGRLPVGPGTRVLDLGCGAGRHAFESLRRGAHVVALDTDLAELKSVGAMVAAMDEAGEVPPEGQATCADGDATRMPFPDGSFDVVIAAEVLEHIPADQAALREISRVLAPGGVAAVTVPAWLPERICWRLSDDYHNVPGGHVRIFTLRELEIKLTAAGLDVGGHHHAHALHSPYWWLKCAVGVHDDQHPLAQAYHRLLVWDIMQRPQAHPARRPGPEPGDRQEPGCLRDQASRGHARTRRHSGGVPLGGREPARADGAIGRARRRSGSAPRAAGEAHAGA